MITHLFSVFDSAAKLFVAPWHAPTVELALRRFRFTVNEPGNEINKFPEEYSLFHVGEFNQETGEIVAYATPRSLGVAVTFMDRPQLEVTDGK